VTSPKRKALEAIEGEVLDGDGSVEVKLRNETVRVLPLFEWRTSATRAMREGDFDSWAEKCLVDGDYEVWTDVDPKIREVEEFFEAWQEATGQDRGKSRASRRSSKSTRKP
jgi:hypothetical protein